MDKLTNIVLIVVPLLVVFVFFRCVDKAKEDTKRYPK